MDKEKTYIKISLALIEDASSINELWYKTWLATYPNKELGITVEDIEDRFKDIFSEKEIKKREEKLQQSNNQLTLVAKEADKIVGFCSCAKSENINQLRSIYILPEYQGKGIGKMFWKEVLKFFDKNKDTVVNVASYNTNGIKFYELLGFIDSGKRIEDERFRLKSGVIIPEIEMVIKAK